VTTPHVEPGTLLGGTYQIVRRIGSGGMGEVYEATHARLAHRYAVKFLHPGLRDHPEALPRFMREAQVTSRLRHPGIVSVVDFNTLPGGIAYLVMEYLDGEPLGKLLARVGPLPLPRVVEITDQLSSALMAAHLEGVVHRDMHPQNVFVLPAARGQSERVKILDFGISKIASLSQKLTGAAAVLGTPQYMSPEQAEGKSDELDAATDQFSLGTIVYEMLTGRPAFDGTTLASIAYQIVHAKAPSIQDFRPELPAELDKVITRALAKDKKSRFPSVSEFALHFRWTAALPGTDVPPKPVVKRPAHGFDPEEKTAVSALPSGMAEVIRQTSGLSWRAVTPAPAPGVPTPRPTVHSDPTVVSTSHFAADDPSLVSRAFFDSEPSVEWQQPRRWVPGNGLAVAGVLLAAVAVGLVLRGRVHPSETAARAPAPAVSAPVAATPREAPPSAPAPLASPSPPPAPAGQEATEPAPAARAGERTADRKPMARAHARPASVKAAATQPEQPATGPANCRLTVGSFPWSDLWVDGADTGLQTPVVDLPLACGLHKLEFKRRDLRVDQIENVTVNEGHAFKRQYELEGVGVDD